MSILTKMENLSGRTMNLMLLGIIVLALLSPLGLPLRVSVHTKALYDRIESLPAGSYVAYSAEIEPGAGEEYAPTVGAVFTHLLRRPVKIVLMFFLAEGPIMFSRMLRLGSAEIPPDKKYGVDYVNLGYVPGDETAMAAAAADMRKTFPKDFYGTPVEELPIMKDIKSAKDFQLLVDVAGGQTDAERMLRQWGTTYGVPMAWIGYASMPQIGAAYYPKQIFAILGGTRAAAEYELLIRRPRVGLQNTDALSLSQTLILVFIALGNLAFLTKKRTGGDKS